MLFRRPSGVPALIGTCLFLLAAVSPSAAAEETEATAMGETAAPAALTQALEEATEAATASAHSAVGWLELSGPLREGPVPFAWVSPADAGPSLDDVLRQLQAVARGEHYRGMVIYFNDVQLSLPQVQALRAEVQAVRESGKRVLAFAESYTLRDYLLASACDLVLLQHKGELDLSGIGVEEIYLAGLLEKIGVQADLMQVGRFKGADEQFMRSAPSEAWNQNMDALLDDLYAQVIEPIAQSRGLSVEALEAVLRDAWSMSDQDYLRSGLVDMLVDRDLVDVTEIEYGQGFTWDDRMGLPASGGMRMDNPFAFFQTLFQQSTRQVTRPSIAVIHASGPITSGDSSYGGGLFGEQSIGSRTLIRTLGEARDNDAVKGVILYIDSPGGSALASEVIWQAMRGVAAVKPVYAVIGSTGASGGYYIACGADQIYVAPSTIVGSIGVVGGKVVLGGLYETLGVSVTRRSRGPHGDLFNSVEPFTADQRQLVRTSLERVYTQFKERVTLGRGTRVADIDAIAEGRLFMGRQAVANGMADALGHLDDAVVALAEQVELETGAYDVVHLPEPVSLGEFLGTVFGVSSPRHAATRVPQASLLLDTARQVFGPTAWPQVAGVAEGLLLLRTEPALCLTPAAIVVR